MTNIINWQETKLPDEMCDLVVKELSKHDGDLQSGKLTNGSVVSNIRDSSLHFFNNSNWVAGWLWYYVEKINRGNFKYDIIDFDGNALQYTTYSAQAEQHYDWHSDQELDSVYPYQDMSERVSTRDFLSEKNKDDTPLVYMRKLSCTVQLSHPADYEGGEFEIKDFNGNSHLIKKERGHLTVFDSRCQHRVKPVTGGMRKSLVAWVVGPRWK
jgi:PKHD-type hydroxylase